MEKELAEIRREVVECRNLVIKTDNLLKNLHAELKLVSRRQDDIAKRGWVGSAFAYGFFGALAITGAVLVSSARISSARDDVAASSKQADELRMQAATALTEQAARKTSADQAARLYAQIADGLPESRLKAAEGLPGLDRSRLSPLESRALDDRARLLKEELAAAALDAGRGAFHKQDMKTAAVELERFLSLTPDSPDALQASFMVGNALHEEKDFQGAIPYLVRFVANGKGQKNLDYAMFMLGHAYEATGAHAHAADVMRHAIEEHPGSEFLPQMRGVLARAQHAGDSPKEGVASPRMGPLRPMRPTPRQGERGLAQH